MPFDLYSRRRLRDTGLLPHSVSLPLGQSSVLPMFMPSAMSFTNSVALRENGAAAESRIAQANAHTESAMANLLFIGNILSHIPI